MRIHTAIAEETRRAVALRPRLLSLRETMVLAGIIEKEKEVRNDILRGVLPAANVIRIDNSRLCFHWPYVLTFAAVYGNRFLDSMEMRRVALEKSSLSQVDIQRKAASLRFILLPRHPHSRQGVSGVGRF